MSVRSKTAVRNSAILVVGAAVCFGTTGTAQALGGVGASTLSLGAARIVFGGGLLAAIALIALAGSQHRRARSSNAAQPNATPLQALPSTPHPLTQRAPIPARPETPHGDAPQALPPALHTAPHTAKRRRLASAALIAIGALGVAGYQPAFFTGTSENGVAVGTLVALGSASVLTGALEWAVLRRAPGMRWAIATAVAALGVAALSGAFAGLFTFGSASGAAAAPAAAAAAAAAATGNATFTAAAAASAASVASTASAAITPLGLLASLAAGGCYAVYALSSKALLDRHFTPTAAMGATFGTAAVIMLPVLLSSDHSWLATPAGAVTAAWLAIIATAVAYTLFARGLRGLKASRAATLTLVEPLTATVLGVIVLHEQFTASTVLGLALLVIGLGILTVTLPRPHHTTPMESTVQTATDQTATDQPATDQKVTD